MSHGNIVVFFIGLPLVLTGVFLAFSQVFGAQRSRLMRRALLSTNPPTIHSWRAVSRCELLFSLGAFACACVAAVGVVCAGGEIAADGTLRLIVALIILVILLDIGYSQWSTQYVEQRLREKFGLRS